MAIQALTGERIASSDSKLVRILPYINIERIVYNWTDY